MVKLFNQNNKTGKIELTMDELEKLLKEAKQEGIDEALELYTKFWQMGIPVKQVNPFDPPFIPYCTDKGVSNI